MRTLLQRAALVALGLALGLGLLEGGLRLAAFVLPAHFERESAAARRAAEPGELLVLCVGDSQTWGFLVEPAPADADHDERQSSQEGQGGKYCRREDIRKILDVPQLGASVYVDERNGEQS